MPACDVLVGFSFHARKTHACFLYLYGNLLSTVSDSCIHIPSSMQEDCIGTNCALHMHGSVLCTGPTKHVRSSVRGIEKDRPSVASSNGDSLSVHTSHTRKKIGTCMYVIALHTSM